MSIRIRRIGGDTSKQAPPRTAYSESVTCRRTGKRCKS